MTSINNIKNNNGAKATFDLKIIQNKLHDNSPLNWVFTGDSITQGVLHTNGFRNYAELFAEGIHWDLQRTSDVIVNTGISGHRIDEIVAGFESRIKFFRPEIVFLMIGTNDAIAGLPGCEAFHEKILSVVRDIRKINAIPILQTPNPIHQNADNGSRSHIAKYAEQIREVAKHEDVILIDHYEYWQQEKSSDDALIAWLNDGLHPNEYGHRVFARTIFKTLIPDSTIAGLH